MKLALITACITSIIFLAGCARTRSGSTTSPVEIDNANIRFEQLKSLGNDLRGYDVDLGSQAKTKAALQTKSLQDLRTIRSLVKRFCDNGKNVLQVANQPDVDYPATKQLKDWVDNANIALRQVDARISIMQEPERKPLSRPSVNTTVKVPVKVPVKLVPPQPITTGQRLSQRGITDDQKRCGTYLKSNPVVEGISVLNPSTAQLASLSAERAGRVRVAMQTAKNCQALTK